MESAELDKLKRELEAWRSSKDKGRRIPEELWQRAAALAPSLGVTRVHAELRLDFKSLKRRMGCGESPGKPKTTFVKLPLPSTSEIGECVLKIESLSGARMQAEISGLQPGGLSQILREFAAS